MPRMAVLYGIARGFAYLAAYSLTLVHSLWHSRTDRLSLEFSEAQRDKFSEGPSHERARNDAAPWHGSGPTSCLPDPCPECSELRGTLVPSDHEPSSAHDVQVVIRDSSRHTSPRHAKMPEETHRLSGHLSIAVALRGLLCGCR